MKNNNFKLIYGISCPLGPKCISVALENALGILWRLGLYVNKFIWKSVVLISRYYIDGVMIVFRIHVSILISASFAF